MLNPTCYFMSVDDCVINIYTNINLHARYHQLCNAKEPPIYELGGSKTGQRTLYHFDDQENRIEVSPDQDVIVFHYPSPKIKQGDSIFYMAYALLERELQENGFLTCHAACIAIGNEGILLLGQSGVGKTSVALKLCMEYGAEIVGNNFCILGSDDNTLVVKRGTRYFHLRHIAIRSNFPHLSYLFPESVTDSWNYKKVVLPEEIGIRSRVHPVKITKIYFLQVDDLSNQVYVNSANGLSSRVYLNENFSRYIRGTSLSILADDKQSFVGYVPSLDDASCFQMRTNIINLTVQHPNAKYLIGSLNGIVAHIVSEIVHN